MMTCITERIYNRAASLERFDGDEELLVELIAIFLEDCPRMLDDLALAFEASDPVAVGRAAHALKGSMSNFDAYEAVEAAAALESAGRRGAIGPARDGYPDLIAAVDRFRDALAAPAEV